MSKVLSKKETVIIEFNSTEERRRVREIFEGNLQDIYNGWEASYMEYSGVFRLGWSVAHPERTHGYSFKMATDTYENPVIVPSEDIQHWSDLVILGIGKIPEKYKECRIHVTNFEQVESLVKLLDGKPYITKPWKNQIRTIYVRDFKVCGWDPESGSSLDYPWVEYDELLGLDRPKTKEDRQAETEEFPKCDCGNTLGLERVKLEVTHCRACDGKIAEAKFIPKSLIEDLREFNFEAAMYLLTEVKINISHHGDNISLKGMFSWGVHRKISAREWSNINSKIGYHVYQPEEIPIEPFMIHKGNTDHAADALSYAVDHLANLPKPTSIFVEVISPSKEDTMNTDTSFETIHKINGIDVNEMSVSQFLGAINLKKEQLGRLESIDIESDVLNAQIAAQNADLALIIEKMEEIHGEQK